MSDDAPAALPHAPGDRAARLRRAFSLRRNLRLLFVPPEHHVRPVDGLRAISILWVVAFHAGWYSARHIPVPLYAELVFARWMLPIWRGDFAVDIFFVLSGFLIAGMLLDERASTGRVRVGLFYARRMLRLWPALAVAALAEVCLLDDHPRMIWANALYVGNFVPILDGAMGWTWSLAIEEQFYLVCPWLLHALAPRGPRAALSALAAVALGLVLVGAGVVIAGRFHAIDAEIVVNRDFAIWAVGYDHLYDKPWMRAGPLLAGVACAYLYRVPRAMEAIAKSRAIGVLGLALALVVAALATHWPLVDGAPRRLEVGFLASYRTIFGVAVGYVLLLVVSKHPVGAALGRALSSRWLYPFAQLAYAAYLVNPIATTLVDGALAPLVWQGRARPMPLFLPFDALATFAAALALHLVVERPFMELRPRGERARAR